MASTFASPAENGGTFAPTRAIVARETRAPEPADPYREIFECNPRAMWVFDSRTLRFLAVNEAAIEEYGYSRDEFLAMTIKEIRPPEDVPELLRLIENRAVLDAAAPRIWRHRRKDGAVREVEIMSREITFAGSRARLVAANDVTDRERAKRALEAGEKRLREIFDASLDAVAINEVEQGTFVDVNHEFERLTGFGRDEAVGRTPQQIGIWDDNAVIRSIVSELRAPGTIRNREVELRRRDGTTVWTLFSAACIDVSGVRCAISFARDISERKRAERRLRESEERYRELVERSPDGLVVHAGGRIAYANPAAARLIGAGQPSELVGRHPIDFVHPDDRDKVARRMTDSEHGRRLSEITHERLLRLDGSVLEAEVLAAPIVYDGVRAVQVLVRDLSQRLASERELIETRDRLNDLYESLDRVFWSRDLATGAMIHVSQACPRVFGRPAEDFLQDRNLWKDVVHPEDMPAMSAAHRALRAGEAVTLQYRVVWPDGSIRWLETHMKPALDDAGQPVRLDGVCTDVSERRAAEEELTRARDGVLAASRLKSAFLANMSHEIRTPLNVISGFHTFIADHLAEIGDHSQDVLVEGIDRACRRLVTTVHGVLDLAKMEAGEFTIYPETVDLAALARRQVARFEKLAQRQRITLTCVVDDERSFAEFDEYCLSQALDQLIANAIKFTAQGGVTVHLRRAVDSGYVLEVADTGVGMDEQYIARLFEPFSQEDSGYTRRFEGSGLGLALVRRYVELNGATVAVESRKGCGSVFRIAIGGSQPASTAPVAELPAAAIADPSSLSQTILVVEDDEITQVYMSTVLERAGYRVLRAASGAEFRFHLAAREREIALVLMDLSLRGPEDGLALVRYLRERDGHRRRPVIAVTAHAFGDDQRSALAAGCDDYFTKPIAEDALMGRVRTLLAARARSDRR